MANHRLFEQLLRTCRIKKEEMLMVKEFTEIKLLPGQSSILHSYTSLDFPGQSLPPFAGSGLAQVRYLNE